MLWYKGNTSTNINCEARRWLRCQQNLFLATRAAQQEYRVCSLATEHAAFRFKVKWSLSLYRLLFMFWPQAANRLAPRVLHNTVCHTQLREFESRKVSFLFFPTPLCLLSLSYIYGAIKFGITKSGHTETFSVWFNSWCSKWVCFCLWMYLTLNMWLTSNIHRS